MLLLVLWFHGLGLVPLADVDNPGVPNVEVCISRCEVEWFIAGGNERGAFVPRDAEGLLGSVQPHGTDQRVNRVLYTPILN